MQFKRLLLCALIPFLISCAREPKESNFLPDLITHDIVSKQMKKCKTISCVETAYGDALEDRADPKTGLLIKIWKTYDDRPNFFSERSKYKDHIIESSRSLRVYYSGDTIKKYQFMGTVYAMKRGLGGSHAFRLSLRNHTKEELNSTMIPIVAGESVKLYKEFYNLK